MWVLLEHLVWIWKDFKSRYVIYIDGFVSAETVLTQSVEILFQMCRQCDSSIFICIKLNDNRIYADDFLI